MTRINFYILASGNPHTLPAACALCEKAVDAGLKIYAHLPSAALTSDFDSALWTLRQNSFIPHEHYTGTALEPPLPPVLFGQGEPPEDHHDVLINLGLEVPAFFSRFTRVLEVVSGIPEQRKASRQRYAYYRERGYPLALYEQTTSGGWIERKG